MKERNKKIVKKTTQVMLASLTLAGGVNAYVNTDNTGVKAEESSVKSNTQVISYVDGNTTWKYLDNNTDPASGLSSLNAWTLANFDDSSWKSVAGTFGAKKGSLTAIGTITPTVLLNQYIENTTTNIPTYFFRTTFTVSKEDILEGAILKGTMTYDDGAIVYLNGEEVANLGGTKADSITKDTTTNLYYGGDTSGAGDPATSTFSIEASKLKEGDNVLAVELHQSESSSSDIYFAMSSLTLEVEDTTNVTQSNVILTMGENEKSKNLTWYADIMMAGKVQIAKKGNSTSFPEEYTEISAVSSASNDASAYVNKATLTNLEANTEYVYRVVNGKTVSKTYSFKTDDFEDNSFTFAFVGDPQIGASGNATTDSENWDKALASIATFNADFLLSAGDQVNNASSESEYDGYVNEDLASLASAPTIGNHDSGSIAFSQHYNLPNVTSYGTTTAGGDYYFTYENTLFMVINTNNSSVAEHKAFIEEAIAANPDVTWKTLMFHQSIYSSASHWQDSQIINLRNTLPEMLEGLDIDVVLMGHDHVYTRSYIMDGITATQQGTDSYVVNPDGILYLTANSASGSKYYNLQDGAINAGYAAKYSQAKLRTATKITVTDTSYTMSTYFIQSGTTNDTKEEVSEMTLLDEYTIYKVDKTALKNAITEAKTVVESEYTQESWKNFAEALDDAEKVSANADALQEDVDAAKDALVQAKEALKKEEQEVVVDRSALKELLEEVSSLQEEDYTQESWKVFAEALENAESVYVLEESTQEEIDNALETLQSAYKNLVKEEKSTNTSGNVDTGDTTNVKAFTLLLMCAGALLFANKEKFVKK